MATELTSAQQPVLIHHGDEQGRLLGDHHHTAVPGHHIGVPGHHHTGVPVQHAGAVPAVAAVPVLVGAVPVQQGYAVPQHAGPVKHKGGPLKPLLALLLLALALTLLGLLAYQAQGFFGGWFLGGYGYNNTETSSNDGFGGPVGGIGSYYGYNQDGYNQNGYNNQYNGYWGGDNVGFNGAGAGMFFFGILFAVLMAVTALTMWVHLAYYFPYLRHSSVMGPLKVTAAVGFIAMGFACRHISLGARDDTSDQHRRITHAIEAFIIINWFIVMLVLILSLVSKAAHWDCENLEEHRITKRMTAGWTQFWLAVVLIGLISAYFQLYTGRYLSITSVTEMLLVFGIMFAVLQLISGLAMVQQCGYNAPGQLPETVHALLKVVVAFGVIAFGFACRSIYRSTHDYESYGQGQGQGLGSTGNGLGVQNNLGNNAVNNGIFGNNNYNSASPHLIAIQAFIIINFIVTLWLTWASSHGTLNWDNYNTTIGKRTKGMIFGVIQLIFSIILFGMLAGLLQGLTGNDPESLQSINIAGKYMVWFALLFAVFEFFAGCTMLESGTKKLGGLNPSSVSVVNKVALALGALAFGFACRHINIHRRYGSDGPRTPLVHAIESFIIINFFITWLIDFLCVRGKIEW